MHDSVHHNIAQSEYNGCMTASVVWWSEFLATDPEVPGSIPDATRFSEKWRVSNGSTQSHEDN
jgi:hypothetical protein